CDAVAVISKDYGNGAAASSCHLSAIRGALGPLAEKRSARVETHGVSRVDVLDMKLMSRYECDLWRLPRTNLACLYCGRPSGEAPYGVSWLASQLQST